jgi:hypothetical protein
MSRVLLASLLFALSFSVMAIEEPKHRVIETVGKIELRDYEPALLAEVEVSGERSAAINQAFRILAGYIFGGNQGQTKIAMTAPVTQESIGAGAESRWRVAFMMPSKYTMDTLPKPNDERVKFRVSDPVKRVAIVFDGLSTQSNLGTHREQLEAFVKERGLKTKGEYTMAFYNDPFTLPWNRRNEWWVAIE